MKIVENTSDNWWDDDDFQDRLVHLLTRDVTTLRACASVLDPNDFRPLRGSPNGRARWMVAERALEHYARYHEPLGKLLRADLLSYAQTLNLGASHLSGLKDYLKQLDAHPLSSPDAVVGRVVEYKSARIRAAVLQEMVEAQSLGQLDDEKWRALSQKALVSGKRPESTDYLTTAANRVERRARENRRSRTPWTLIDPLDSMIRTVGPRQLGLVLAPYKRGKSMFLLWLAVAFCRQRLNVLYLTLEDPLFVAEDRLDSIITNIPMKSLGMRPKTFRRQFERFRLMINARLKLYDGTDENMSLARVEQIVLAEREQGFLADVLIIDYDEKILPKHHYKEKRFEFDEVYSELVRLVARYNLIGWTAAQTQRDTRHMKILSGDRAAEDIGKVRKVTCALALGKGEWTEESIYLWVAAHKCDRMEVGCEIVPNLKSMLIYDHEATRQAAAANGVSYGDET